MTSTSIKRLILLLLTCTLSSAYAATIASWTLPNGTRVLFVENHNLPIVDISVNFDAGSRFDPKGKSGVATMTHGMLTLGIAASQQELAMSEAQISDMTADLAMRLGGSAGADRASVDLRTLSNAPVCDAAVSLAARVMAQPAFPETVLMREKARAVAAIREADSRPASIASKAFGKALYAAHPYGFSPTAVSIDSISRSDLIAFHRTHYVTDRAVIAIVGDVTRAQADAYAMQLTQRLPRSEAALPMLPDVTVTPAHEERIAHPASQAHILLGVPSLRRGDPDYFALMVGNYVLGGGGFVSRLMNEIREKRGLSYSIGSSFNPMKQQGPFRISLQTKKAQADEALKVVRATVMDFLRDGPTKAEIKAAKDYLIGGFALNIDTNSKMLENVAVIGYYGLPLDYLETWKQNVAKVSVADVRAAFNRKLAFEKMSTVIVGAPE